MSVGLNVAIIYYFLFFDAVICSTKFEFDERYLRLQGFQINNLLASKKSASNCWKNTLEKIQTDCKGDEEKTIVWVSYLKFFMFYELIVLHQKRNAWKLLNCEQEDSNRQVISCNTSDWKDTKSCVLLLSEKDAMNLSLMMGLVAPLCKYLEGDNGFYASILDTYEQVKLSFTLNEQHREITMSHIGKIVVSQTLPMYGSEFYSHQFIIFPLWFIFAYLFGGTTCCHMAVIGLFTLEVLTVAIRRSYLGFIFSLFYLSDHVMFLITLK